MVKEYQKDAKKSANVASKKYMPDMHTNNGSDMMIAIAWSYVCIWNDRYFAEQRCEC